MKKFSFPCNKMPRPCITRMTGDKWPMLSILMTTEYTPAADNAALKQLLSGVAAGDIGYAKARSIALTHAGVRGSAAYDIHAVTGEILKHGAERDD